MYPYRNPRVQLDLPQPELDTRLILNHETGRYVRLGLREYEWLQRLDGQTHVRDVANLFGQDEAFVQELLRRMEAAKLICLSEESVKLQPSSQPVESRATPRWFEWTQFGQLRIHLWQPQAYLERASGLTRLLMSKPFVAAGLLISVVGFIVGIMQGTELAGVVQNFPWHVGQIVGIVALIFGTTVIHELGHALACAYFGAPVRSLGIMLFYLQPAAYADVTDSWQLKNRWHRVAISSAGIYVQAVITSLAVLLWTLLRVTGHRGDVIVMFAAANAAMIIFNIIPFIKLDGYWILSNILGIVNMRDRATEWFRVSMLAAITRRPIQASQLRYNALLSMPPLDRSLLACFGLTSMIFGVAMWFEGLNFLFTLTRWVGMAQVTSYLAVSAAVVTIGVAFGIRLLLARRRGRRPQAVDNSRRLQPVSATVTYSIDRHRRIRLNPHVSAVDNRDGTITFGWSAPDALTVRAAETLFDAVPTLRQGEVTLHDLAQSPAWDAECEQALQRLWHHRHLRYSSDWDVPEDITRYSRQLGWFSMNAEVRGKELEVLSRLRGASVTILGVGGLGTHVAWNLAACGVGELHLVDGDSIELTNLNRQLFYTPADIGRAKVDVTAERLAQFDPGLRIRKTQKYLSGLQDVMEVIKGSSFVVRSLDTPMQMPEWVNEACVRLGIPYTGGGFLEQWVAIGPTVIPGETSCAACNLPPRMPKMDRGTGGTLAPLVVTSAGLLAGEVITYLGKLGRVQTAGRILMVSAPTLAFNISDIPRNGNCPICGKMGGDLSA